MYSEEEVDEILKREMKEMIPNVHDNTMQIFEQIMHDMYDKMKDGIYQAALEAAEKSGEKVNASSVAFHVKLLNMYRRNVLESIERSSVHVATSKEEADFMASMMQAEDKGGEDEE